MIRTSGDGEGNIAVDSVPSNAEEGQYPTIMASEQSVYYKGVRLMPPPPGRAVQPRRRANKLDMRFADEDDCEDILNLINQAFLVEMGDTGLAFKNCNRMTSEEVMAHLRPGASSNWVVLESQPPEEVAVAAALVVLAPALREGRVACLAVHPSVQRRGIGRYLLHKVESIFSNFACKDSVVQTAEWRTDVQSWLLKNGYKEMGGGLWPHVEHCSRPTSYLLYKKRLGGAPTAAAGDEERRPPQQAAAAAGGRRPLDRVMGELLGGGPSGQSEKDLTEEEGEEVCLVPERGGSTALETQEPPMGKAAPPSKSSQSMEDVLSHLFSVLHTEKGRRELHELSRQQQQDDAKKHEENFSASS
mmetsp:Transcript_25173/g.39653  ORF Transcript_25173/g.39653 Transcript_25173/m.39653 type:complete len:359 (-) Transcript_25173:234-1310(-)